MFRFSSGLGSDREGTPSRSRSKWLSFLLAGVPLAAIAIILFRHWPALRSYEWDLHLMPLLASFGTYTLGLVLVSLIWGGLMNLLTARLPRKVHFKYFCLSNAAKRLPGRIWHFAGRAYFYRQHDIGVRVTSVVSGLETVLLVSSGLLIGVALGAANLVEGVPVFFVVVLALSLGIGFTHPGIVRAVLRRIGGETPPGFGYLPLLLAFVGYVIVWLLGGLTFFFIVNAFGELGTEYMSLTIGIWSFVGSLSFLLFFLPVNFGLTEVGIGLLLSVALPLSVALTVALLTRLLITLFDAGWALMALQIE